MPLPPLDVQFKQVFAKYLELNKALPQELATKKAGDFAFKLFKLCFDHKALKSKITQDVRSRGWAVKVPRKFRDAKKANWKRLPGEKNSKAALKRFQDDVIELRMRGVAFIAVGWLGAAKKLGAATTARVRAEKILGDVTISIQQYIAHVTMWNETPGVQTLHERFGISRDALEFMIADMNKYIDRKVAGLSGKAVGGYHG